MLKKLLIGIFAIIITGVCMYLVIPHFNKTLFISLDTIQLEEEVNLFDNKYKEIEKKYNEVKKAQDTNVSNVNKKEEAKRKKEQEQRNTYSSNNNYNNYSSSGRTSSSSGRTNSSSSSSSSGGSSSSGSSQPSCVGKPLYNWMRVDYQTQNQCVSAGNRIMEQQQLGYNCSQIIDCKGNTLGWQLDTWKPE